MTKPKKQEKENIKEVPKEVLKYWYVDFKNKKIKHVKKYEKKLISFNSDEQYVVDEDKDVVHVYTNTNDAHIQLSLYEIEEMRILWQHHVDESMEVNKTISKMIDKLNKLRED